MTQNTVQNDAGPHQHHYRTERRNDSPDPHAHSGPAGASVVTLCLLEGHRDFGRNSLRFPEVYLSVT